jgi:hypothetical protein
MEIGFDEVNQLLAWFLDEHPKTVLASQHHGSQVISAQLFALADQGNQCKLLFWNRD